MTTKKIQDLELRLDWTARTFIVAVTEHNPRAPEMLEDYRQASDNLRDEKMKDYPIEVREMMKERFYKGLYAYNSGGSR